MRGEVYIIGAGCGDYDLITLRGKKYLEKCDTVIYDALTDKRLLGFVPENAEKIYVGKRSGNHGMSQDEINSLIVKKALEGKNTARLKGGDPFVFGRVAEEISELIKNKIPYTVIPGISSAIAVPELAGIPVTSRSESRSFHVITAHTADGISPEYFGKYTALDGTLIFLMGLHNLKLIADSLVSAGFDGKTSAAVISEGASRRQKIIRSDLENIYEKTSAENIKPPAVIVVGKNAAYDLSGNIKYPLSEISVTAAGSKRFIGKLSDIAEENVADVHRLEIVRIKEYPANTDFENALKNIRDYGYIVLMSIYGAEIFFEKMKENKIDIRNLYKIKFAVIGKQTAAYLSERGIFADIIPGKYNSSELGTILAEKISSEEKILILNSENSSGDLTNILDKNSMKYDNIKIYHTQKLAVGNCHIDDDYIVFGSSAGAEAFFENKGTVSEKTTAVCIGEPTRDTLIKYFHGKILTADEHTAKGIIDKIIEHERDDAK